LKEDRLADLRRKSAASRRRAKKRKGEKDE